MSSLSHLPPTMSKIFFPPPSHTETSLKKTLTLSEKEYFDICWLGLELWKEREGTRMITKLARKEWAEKDTQNGSSRRDFSHKD